MADSSACLQRSAALVAIPLASALCYVAYTRRPRVLVDANEGSGGPSAAGGGSAAVTPPPPPPPSQPQPQPQVGPPSPGPSEAGGFCKRQPGWVSEDVSAPIRSPLAVVDLMLPHIRGKRVCEIGTRTGDILWCMSRAAASATGFELEVSYCAALSRRGLNVSCGNFLHRTAGELARQCEVYYCFPEEASMSYCFLAHIRSAMQASKTPSVSAIIAYDAEAGASGPLQADLKMFNGTLLAQMSFDERADFYEGRAQGRLPWWVRKHAGGIEPRTRGTWQVAQYELGYTPGEAGAEHAKSDAAAKDTIVCKISAGPATSDGFGKPRPRKVRRRR